MTIDLRDYEKLKRQVGEIARLEIGVPGTFTPSWRGLSTAGTFTYNTTATTGVYLRVGNIVLFQCRLLITAISVSPVGNLVIDGLPVAMNSTAGRLGGVAFTYISNFNYSASAIELLGRINPGEQSIRLAEAFDNAVAVDYPGSNFTNAAADVSMIGLYFI